MKVKRIEPSLVTADELNQYKEKISKLKGVAFNASDVDIDKRIITIRFGGEYEELNLVNPKVTEKSDQLVVYFEKDSAKNKVRKTARHTWFKVDTDNLGVVEFSSDKQTWENEQEFMNDMGLFECVLAQRLIDSIDGIDITSPLRQYNPQIVKKETPGRNERVMLQSPTGEMEFVKYKVASTYINKGYKMM
jgi:peptide deformylase